MNNIQNKENKSNHHLIFVIECRKMLLHNKVGKLIVINSSTEWKSMMDSINKEVNNNTYRIKANFLM